jgi:hypothetical protein
MNPAGCLGQFFSKDEERGEDSGYVGLDVRSVFAE